MNQTDALSLLTDLIKKARKAGADAADAVYVEGVSLSHAQRLGAIEKLERSEAQDMGLRVLVGQRQAIVSSTDQAAKGLDALVERAVAMARAVPEDPYIGLADRKLLARDLPDLDLLDPGEPAPEALIERAKAAEDAARAVKGVTNSEGAEAGWGRRLVALATSDGFTGAYGASSHSVAVSVIAGEGLGMERDHDWASAVHGSDLDDPAAVGLRAGEKAVRRLGPKKAKSARVPIVYDPRVSGGLLGHLASAINGAAIARGTSFLRGKMGADIFPAAITIVDDPHRKRGLRSKPFDGEGVANERRAVIDRGRLTTWLLDSRSARQLGLASTGHAARGTSSPPSPSATNLYLEAGGAHAAGADGGHRERLLRHRADRLRHQRHHRRLQPRRRRLLDRERRARLSGQRGHGRGQSARDVQEHERRQRPGLPPRRRRADRAHRRHDRRGDIRGGSATLPPQNSSPSGLTRGSPASDTRRQWRHCPSAQDARPGAPMARLFAYRRVEWPASRPFEARA